MIRLSTSLLSLVALLPVATYGANDWSKPCFEGICSWDVNDGSSASGGLTLAGSSNAISDITTAAGWEMLSCQTNGTTTTVRMVCSSDDTSSAGCDHVEQNGAEQKIVRLPPGCGAAPFGRVANMQTSQNQTIPSTTRRRLHRRSGVPAPQVKEMTLDIEWSAIPVSKNGQVQMYIAGANIPGAENIHNNAVATSTRRRRRFGQRGIERRGFFSDAFGDIGNVISGAAQDVENGVDDAVSAIASVATEAASAVVNVATEAASAIVSVATEAASAVVNVATEAASAAVAVATDAADVAESIATNSINENRTLSVPLVNFNQDFTLINQTLGCGGNFTAALDIHGSAASNVTINAGLVAVGTIVPPNLTQFQVLIGGNADFLGSLSVTAGLDGPFSTSVITLVQPVAVAGFTIPEILTLGPSLELTGQVTGELDLTASLDATLSFSTGNLQIVFPPQSNQTSTGTSNLNSSPLQLSLSPGVTGSASAELHLTPTFQIGLNAFSNKVQADVFVDLDVGLQVNATVDSSSPFSGNVDLAIPLSINVGANGDFFGLLDGRDQFTLFTHTFPILSKPFGNSTSTRRAFDESDDTEALAPSGYAPRYLPISSIQAREDARLAERADRTSGYHKRGAFAVLAERQSLACPASDTSSDLQQVAASNGTVTGQ